MSNIEIEIEVMDDICVASGVNWKYEQIGTLSKFTQAGKVPSLRVIKSAIKLMNKRDK